MTVKCIETKSKDVVFTSPEFKCVKHISLCFMLSDKYPGKAKKARIHTVSPMHEGDFTLA